MGNWTGSHLLQKWVPKDGSKHCICAPAQFICLVKGGLFCCGGTDDCSETTNNPIYRRETQNSAIYCYQPVFFCLPWPTNTGKTKNMRAQNDDIWEKNQQQYIYSTIHIVPQANKSMFFERCLALQIDLQINGIWGGMRLSIRIEVKKNVSFFACKLLLSALLFLLQIVVVFR